jgi:hypothetical protein
MVITVQYRRFWFNSSEILQYNKNSLLKGNKYNIFCLYQAKYGQKMRGFETSTLGE